MNQKLYVVCAAGALFIIALGASQVSHAQTISTETASRTVEDGGTGPYTAVMVTDSTLDTHTIFRPADLSPFDEKNPLPIIAWGNGACANSPWEHVNFLSEVASHGFLVIAIGPMPQEGQRGGGRSESSQLLDAINWTIAQNDNETSPYYKKIDTDKIAVSGMSCGGLQTLEVAPDPRITTAVVCNSGILPNPNAGMAGMPGLTKDHLEKLHTPTLYILGGESDIAYNNGMDDFKRINHVPVFAANLDVGHGGTYSRPHGGDFAIVATAWYQWQLKDDQEAAKMFIGKPSGVARMPGWTLETKNSEVTNESQATDMPKAAAPKRIVVIDDIAYRSGPSEAWRLDLAMPENFGPELRPALVIVHGGGWNAGDKRDRPYRSMLLDYALKGYVVISVNYRLMREAPLPACIEDCKCAVRWLKAHAKEYRVDTDRIAAYGHSAGAHLVLMLGLAGPEAGLEGDGGWDEYSSSITAVVGGSAPTELPGRFGDPEKYSPLTYVTADALPILLIQGTADNIVRKEVTDRFVEKMKDVGAKEIRYEVIEGAQHDVAYNNYLGRSSDVMTRFFADVLK